MEPVWNGILTCDYEASRPEATPLEWDLYTTSLIAWPSVLLGEPTPYGRLRRPGIVDIPETAHTRLVAILAKRLTDDVAANSLVHGATDDRRRATCAIDALERALAAENDADRAVVVATAVFLRVMSTHIVNWLLPEPAWEDLLGRAFASERKALECLLALGMPTHPGHVLLAHQVVLAAQGDLKEHVARIADARERAAAHREAWETAALLAVAGDDGAVSTVRAVAATLAWAAESEERRKELRCRYLALVRRWCVAAGVDPAVVTTSDLLGLDRAR